VCGLRGDRAARAEWLSVVDAIITPGFSVSTHHYGEFFDALVLLHDGQATEAVRLLATSPEDFETSHSVAWRPWYAALWAEAAVIAGDPAAALAAADRAGLLAAAERLRAAGCRYQWARTLVLAGGPERAVGQDELAAMGATPMAAG